MLSNLLPHVSKHQHNGLNPKTSAGSKQQRVVTFLDISQISRPKNTCTSARYNSIRFLLLCHTILSLRRFNHSVLPLRPPLPGASPLHATPSQLCDHRRRASPLSPRPISRISLRPNWACATIIYLCNLIWGRISTRSIDI